MRTINHDIVSSSLYIGDLSEQVSESTLFQLFSQIGALISVRICRDKNTNRSLKYGFVNFQNPEDAENALTNMNYTDIDGRCCRMMWVQHDPSMRKSPIGNIFVKNLDRSINSKRLFKMFTDFGKIMSCKVSCDNRGKSNGFGFVHYDNETSAKKAIITKNNNKIGDSKIIVCSFIPKFKRNINKKPPSTNLYVKNFSTKLTDKEFCEIFTKFGKITSYHLAIDENNNLKGFGFVSYENEKSANLAIEELNEKGPLNLYVCKAEKREERSKKLNESFQKHKMKVSQENADKNVFVKNLPMELENDGLYKLFEEFGEITSAKVMVNSSKCSRGFGFVCFKDRKSAVKAIKRMNQKVVSKKPLFVGFAQNKEVRQQLLLARATQMANLMDNREVIPRPLYYSKPSTEMIAYNNNPSSNGTLIKMRNNNINMDYNLHNNNNNNQSMLRNIHHSDNLHNNQPMLTNIHHSNNLQNNMQNISSYPPYTHTNLPTSQNSLYSQFDQHNMRNIQNPYHLQNNYSKLRYMQNLYSLQANNYNLPDFQNSYYSFYNPKNIRHARNSYYSNNNSTHHFLNSYNNRNLGLQSSNILNNPIKNLHHIQKLLKNQSFESNKYNMFNYDTINNRSEPAVITERKRNLGMIIYNMTSMKYPEIAGMITGLFLEMNYLSIMNILKNEKQFLHKVDYCAKILMKSCKETHKSNYIK